MKKTLSRIEDLELNFKVSNLRGPIGFHEMFNHKRNIEGILFRSYLLVYLQLIQM